METTLAAATEEFSAWGQTDFIRRVSVFRDQFEPGHPGHGLPENFVWVFVASFRLSMIAGAPETWVRWSAAEKAAWVEDYSPGEQEHMEVYWFPMPCSDPVVLVEGGDGRFYAWDGNHRIGVAFTAGLQTIPAIVGVNSR